MNTKKDNTEIGISKLVGISVAAGLAVIVVLVLLWAIATGAWLVVENLTGAYVAGEWVKFLLISWGIVSLFFLCLVIRFVTEAKDVKCKSGESS